MEILKKIIEKFEEYKGQFVITDRKVCRLIMVCEDETDFYWGFWDGKENIRQLCIEGFVPLEGEIDIEGFIPLKGKIDDAHYDKLVQLGKLEYKEFIPAYFFVLRDFVDQSISQETVEAFIENLETKEEYLTEVCWKIN